MDDLLLTPCYSSLTLMDLLLHLFLLLPFFALDDACTTVGGPAVNQVHVTIVVTVVVIFVAHTTVPIIIAKVVILKYQACVLPFSFRGKVRTGCINEEDPQGRYWCRLLIESFHMTIDRESC